MIITIDGPAGAGKTTVSRILAQRLGFRYVDTGALYRGIAFAALNSGIEPADDTGLEKMCRGLDIGFVVMGSATRLMLDGRDITEKIRTPEISMAASAVSARPVVRSFLLEIQRELGRQGSAVFEGRDMGTVVFPKADLKFFLKASTSVRALRRYNEFKGSGGMQSIGEVEADIRRRDANDRTRDIAPMRAAEDAVVVDATDVSVDQVVDIMLAHVFSKNKS